MWESVQNLNWAADWLHRCQEGINDVTANLIGSTEELHHMRLKTGFDVNNKQFGKTILSSFRSAAQQSPAKLRNMQTWQLNQSWTRKKLCLNLSNKRTYFEWMWWFPAVLCHAGTISALLFAQSWLLTNSTLGARVFFLSFLIFYSL